MNTTTCWDLIQCAASGDEIARASFSETYLPAVRAYLVARWRRRLNASELEDAVQDVFLACLEPGGVLERARAGEGQGFRAFLFGVVRNVAAGIERSRLAAKDAAGAESFRADELAADEASLSRLFDQAWARNVLQRARDLHAQEAAEAGAQQQRHAELLRLRFSLDLPIRKIAELWGEDPAGVHKAYAKARQEFLACLQLVIAFDHPHDAAAAREECANLARIFE